MPTHTGDEPVEETKTNSTNNNAVIKGTKSIPKLEEETKETEATKKSNLNVTDSDSDESESDEDREKDIQERKKLIEETQEHKQQMVKALYALVCVETIICALLLSPQSDDTTDVVFASVVRILILYICVQYAITWGNVKTYDSDKDKHTIFNTNTSHYKVYTKIKGSAAYIVLLVWNQIIGGKKHISSVNNDGLSSLLSSQNESTTTDNTMTKYIKDKRLKMKKLYDVKELVNKYSGMDAQDVADLWKNVIWMISFFVMTMFTTSIGVKISFFTCDNDRDYYLCITLFVSIVMVTHMQSYFVKKYIDDCCKPQNRYFDLSIHQHPMFKTFNRGRYCQLCYTRPGQNSSERKMIFKCLQCPQHRAFVCVKCWNKKRKEARLRKQDEEEQDEYRNHKDVTFYEYMLTLLKYHQPHMHLLIFGVTAMGIHSVVNVFVPKQKGVLLDRLISGDMDGWLLAIKIQILLTVFQGIVRSIQSGFMSRVSQQIMCDLQKQMFAKILAQDMTFFDNHTTQEINERMNFGLSEMLTPFQDTIRTVLSTFVSLFGALSMCLSISWRLTFIGLSTLGPMSYFMNLFMQWSWRRNMVQQQLRTEMYSISHLGFEYIRSVRAFAKEHEFVRYYNMLRQELNDTDNKKRVTQSVNGIINKWFKLSTKILLTYIAGMIILNKSETTTTLTVGLFVTFETYWKNLYSNIQSIRHTYNSYDRALFMAKKIFRTLEQKTEIETLCTDDDDDDSKEKLITEVDGNIKFENVEFFYESSPNKLVLKSINLEIEKGKITALVGRSGGGKSTIMHLMLRFYDPTKGRISINNIDLKKYNPYSVRRQIALVSQDTELFTKSVEYNIGFGANTKSDEEYQYESVYNLSQVEYAANLANAHKFISEFEDKYDTQMGTRAKRCSGGQKQRISIARMLMSKPSVMLLDEATSSLDAESEALVQAAMERECDEKNCTLVIVAHRLSTVVNADKICVVDDGRIVEEGTHEELVEINGIYASLVQRQINLRTKMKQKLEKMRNGEIKDGVIAEKDNSDDDFDNIDKLIDQIKADKLKKENID